MEPRQSAPGTVAEGLALARRLMTRPAETEEAPGNAAFEARISEHACRALKRSLGATGFHALLTRALAEAQLAHPLLAEVRIGQQSAPILGNLQALIDTHGALAVAAALEGAMASLFSLLGRLIGDDMVARLVERDANDATRDSEEAP